MKWLYDLKLKLKMCWCILCGHPVAYKLLIENGIMKFTPGSQGYVTECTFRNTPPNEHAEAVASEKWAKHCHDCLLPLTDCCCGTLKAVVMQIQ